MDSELFLLSLVLTASFYYTYHILFLTDENSGAFSRFASRDAFCERGEKFMVAASREQEMLCRSSFGLAINLSAIAGGP